MHGAEAQHIACAPGKALAPGQDHGRIALHGQPRSQRHGVGGSPEKWGPHTHIARRHLVRQQAHSFAGAQGAQQLTHTGQVGGRGLESSPGAHGFQQAIHCRATARPKEHSQIAVLGTEARRRSARCEFKTTHVGRQEDDPFARGVGRLHHLQSLPAQGRRGAQPDARKLSNHHAGLGNRPFASVPRQPGLRHIGAEVVPITPGAPKIQPSQ